MSCFFNIPGPTEIYTYGHPLSLHDALPISAYRGSASVEVCNSMQHLQKPLLRRVGKSILKSHREYPLLKAGKPKEGHGEPGFLCECVPQASCVITKHLRTASRGGARAARQVAKCGRAGARRGGQGDVGRGMSWRAAYD